MRTLVKLLVAAVVVMAAYFLLRTRILWLDYFEGSITERVEDSRPTVTKKYTQEISEYFLVVETDDGREVTVPVEQITYFRARPGMRVTKDPFTSDLELVVPAPQAPSGP